MNTAKPTPTSIRIEQLEHHRNGSYGEPFFAAVLTAPEFAEGKFVATIFRTTRGQNPRISVLKIDTLPEIEFGVNSWPGHKFADSLIAAIEERSGEPFYTDEQSTTCLKR